MPFLFLSQAVMTYICLFHYGNDDDDDYDNDDDKNDFK